MLTYKYTPHGTSYKPHVNCFQVGAHDSILLCDFHRVCMYVAVYATLQQLLKSNEILENHCHE